MGFRGGSVATGRCSTFNPNPIHTGRSEEFNTQIKLQRPIKPQVLRHALRRPSFYDLESRNQMYIRPHAKSSLFIAFGLAAASYLFFHQIGKYDPRFAGGGELWQKIAFFLLYLVPYFFGVLATQALCRQEHEGVRRVAIVLSIIFACGATYYAKEENSHFTNGFIASVGWYVSGALIALFVVFSIVQWLVGGFLASRTDV